MVLINMDGLNDGWLEVVKDGRLEVVKEGWNDGSTPCNGVSGHITSPFKAS